MFQQAPKKRPKSVTFGIALGLIFGLVLVALCVGALLVIADPATPSKPVGVASTKPTPRAVTVSARDWAKVIKSPDDHAGKRYVIYGEVNQFDSATGKDSFLADTAHKDTTEHGYFEGENAMLRGEVDKLEDVVENDIFKAEVTVLGSYSYKAVIGGKLTVPELQVDSIKVIGR